MGVARSVDVCSRRPPVVFCLKRKVSFRRSDWAPRHFARNRAASSSAAWSDFVTQSGGFAVSGSRSRSPGLFAGDAGGEGNGAVTASVGHGRPAALGFAVVMRESFVSFSPAFPLGERYVRNRSPQKRSSFCSPLGAAALAVFFSSHQVRVVTLEWTDGLLRDLCGRRIGGELCRVVVPPPWMGSRTCRLEPRRRGAFHMCRESSSAVLGPAVSSAHVPASRVFFFFSYFGK